MLVDIQSTTEEKYTSILLLVIINTVTNLQNDKNSNTVGIGIYYLLQGSGCKLDVYRCYISHGNVSSYRFKLKRQVDIMRWMGGEYSLH